MTLKNDAYSITSFPANNLLPPPKPDSVKLSEASKLSELPKFKNRFRIKRSHTYNRALPLLMPAGVALYHWSRQSSKLKIANIRSKVIDTAKSSEFKDTISEIAPFLDLGVQHNLYTIIGIIDILSETKSLADGSFQKRHIKIPFTNETSNKIRAVIKAIKRLKFDVNGQVLDNVVLSYEISDKLLELMRKGNRGNTKANATKRLDDLFHILKPLVPHKYSSNIDKFTRLIKIAHALNVTDDIMTNSDTEIVGNTNASGIDSKLNTDSPNTHTADSELKKENFNSDTSKTENPNAGSFDMIAKLVQLLS